MRLTSILRRTARPSLIPLIDVMLVLLFFFMLVNSYGGERRSVLQMAPMPTGAASASEITPKPVQLQADGRFQIDTALLKLPDAIEALHAAKAARLSAASDTTLQTLLTGWQQLSAAGITVSLAEAAP